MLFKTSQPCTAWEVEILKSQNAKPKADREARNSGKP